MSRRKPTEAEQVAVLEARLDRARELRRVCALPSVREAVSLGDLQATVSRDDLLQALNWVSYAISRRPHPAGMAGARFTAQAGGLTVAGFDYDCRATQTILAPGSFTWQILMDERVDDYLRSLDEVPHHFQLHLMHATEILGYKHPASDVRAWWLAVYVRLVEDMHLWPETAEQMDARLGDSRSGWLSRNDPATTA